MDAHQTVTARRRPRFTGIHINYDRPTDPYVYLTTDRCLERGREDVIRLSEDELVELIADASARLRDLRDAQ